MTKENRPEGLIDLTPKQWRTLIDTIKEANEVFAISGWKNDITRKANHMFEMRCNNSPFFAFRAKFEPGYAGKWRIFLQELQINFSFTLGMHGDDFNAYVLNQLAAKDPILVGIGEQKPYMFATPTKPFDCI